MTRRTLLKQVRDGIVDAVCKDSPIKFEGMRAAVEQAVADWESGAEPKKSPLDRAVHAKCEEVWTALYGGGAQPGDEGVRTS